MAGQSTSRAVHKRLDRQRGRASTHTCVTCGSQADDWAYQYNAVDQELIDGTHRYTDDLTCYKPMCTPCHMKFDRKMDPEMAERVKVSRPPNLASLGGRAVVAKAKTDPEFAAKIREARSRAGKARHAR